MKAGYTFDELEELNRKRAVRRSFFQTSRRLEDELVRTQWWPLYKKLRRAAAEECRRRGQAGDEAAVDRYLEDALPSILAGLQSHLRRDMAVRKARAVIVSNGAA